MLARVHMRCSSPCPSTARSSFSTRRCVSLCVHTHTHRPYPHYSLLCFMQTALVEDVAESDAGGDALEGVGRPMVRLATVLPSLGLDLSEEKIQCLLQCRGEGSGFNRFTADPNAAVSSSMPPHSAASHQHQHASSFSSSWADVSQAGATEASFIDQVRAPLVMCRTEQNRCRLVVQVLLCLAGTVA